VQPAASTKKLITIQMSGTTLVLLIESTTI
jgi:hypothetical protein